MNKKAFTIIELLITITIIGLLLAAASIYVAKTLRSSRDTKRLTDVLSIAKVIDQAVSTTRGVYPTNVNPSGNSSEMCANEIYNSSNNINNIDISEFTNRQIPVDPNPLFPLLTNCTKIDNGYVYYTEYGHNLNNLNTANLAVAQKVTYTLAVGLEGPKPNDENAFRSPTDLNLSSPSDQDSSAQRFLYILNGTYCGSSCYQ